MSGAAAQEIGNQPATGGEDDSSARWLPYGADGEHRPPLGPAIGTQIGGPLAAHPGGREPRPPGAAVLVDGRRGRPGERRQRRVPHSMRSIQPLTGGTADLSTRGPGASTRLPMAAGAGARPARRGVPTGGFRSDMAGTKATALPRRIAAPGTGQSYPPLRLSRPWPLRGALPGAAPSAAVARGRPRRCGDRPADRRPADPGRFQHGRLDRAARRPAPAGPHPGVDRDRGGPRLHRGADLAPPRARSRPAA